MIPSSSVRNLIVSRLTALCVTLLVAASAAKADLIELVNGDHYNGTVVGLTATQLEFRSDIQGVVKLPRDKVARITLREIAVKPGSKATTPAAGAGTPNGVIIRSAADSQPIVNSPAFAASKPARTAGSPANSGTVDSDVISEIQEKIIGKDNPEASAKFNQMVASLMAGSLSVGDIRAQARSAIKDIESAKKDLGPDAGEMLNGYLKILQEFVRDPGTAPTPTTTK